MSEENVEIVRRVYKLAEARGVEGLLELATDDIVWISDPRFPGGGTYVGVPTAAVIEIVLDEATAGRRSRIAAADAAGEQPV